MAIYIVSDKVSSLLTKAGIIETGKEVKADYFGSDSVFEELLKKGVIIEDKKTIEVKPVKVEKVEDEVIKEKAVEDEKPKNSFKSFNGADKK